ncbi:MAG: zf-HC2 domain-containing protein [Gemmatimonadaceae bacterium]
MQHLDEGTIHAWLDGALDAEEAARVEQHAAQCATCAAAVAEARGLVAGASRILSALDQTPAGVVPQSLGRASAPRRSGSLWHTLRLTPARAAAAAVVVLAAGTALVIRNQPNDLSSRRVFLAADTSPRPRPMAAPMPSSVDSSAVAPSSASAERSNVAPVQRRALPVPKRTTPVEQPASPAPRPALPPAGIAGVAVSSGAAAKTLASPAPALNDVGRVILDSARRGVVAGARVDSTRRLMSVATTGAAEAKATAQSVSRAASAPAARDARATIATISFAGCYAVTADSTTGLPTRLSLDSSRVETVMQRATVAAPERYSVSGTTPLAGALWQRLPDGRIRLSIAPARSVDLSPASNSTLVGSMPVEGRLLPVTLRRVDCGR